MQIRIWIRSPPLDGRLLPSLSTSDDRPPHPRVRDQRGDRRELPRGPPSTVILLSPMPSLEKTTLPLQIDFDEVSHGRMPDDFLELILEAPGMLCKNKEKFQATLPAPAMSAAVVAFR